MTIKAGNCYLVETNRDSAGYINSHLLVVLLDPEERTNETIIVPVDTLRSPKHDTTTILEPGIHEFITKRSYINYRFAKVRSISFIENLQKEKKAKIKDSLDTKVVDKIVEGLRKSDYTPEEVLSMYGYYMMRKIKK